MEETTIPAGGYAFPVDLSREEYVRFNMRMAKERGLYRFRVVMMAAFGLSFVLAGALLVMDMIENRPLDTSLPVLMVFILMSGLVLLFGVPNYIRIKAGRTYDRSLLSGYDFYGVVRVYPNRVEKSAGGRTTLIPLDARAVYAEYEDMMVILCPNQPAIVLSARCVTAEDAEVVRQVARERVPVTHQRLYAKMVSRTDLRLEPPEEAEVGEPDETLLSLFVRYTADEFLTMITHGSLQAFLRMMPLYAGVALIAALALGLSGGPLTMILLFFGVLLVLFLINVVGPRMRMKLRLPAMSEEALSVRLVLSRRGLTLTASTRNTAFYPWLSVTRVLEKKDWYEFQLNSGSLEIPARCVEDPQQLRDIVNAYINRNP